MLQEDKSSVRGRGRGRGQAGPGAGLTFSKSDRRVSMSVVMEGMSVTHWQYSRRIRISSRTVLGGRREQRRHSWSPLLERAQLGSAGLSWTQLDHLPDHGELLPIHQQEVCRLPVLHT